MKYEKVNFMPAFIIGITLTVLGIAGIIAGIKIGNGMMGFVAGVAGITGIIGILAAVFGINKEKIIKARENDPGSLYSKTYCGGDEYQYFLAYPNRKINHVSKTTANILGVLALAAGGVGVLQTEENARDVFVSEEEIYINDRNKNKTFKEEKFVHISASDIKEIQVISLKKFVQVIIVTENKKYTLNFPAVRKRESSRRLLRHCASQRICSSATKNNRGI